MQVQESKRNVALALLRERPRVKLSPSDRDLLRDSFKLSGRELETIELLLRSLRESEIADDFQISSHTVHTHVGRIYRKLNVRSVSELVLRVVSLCGVLGDGTFAINTRRSTRKTAFTLRGTERVP